MYQKLAFVCGKALRNVLTNRVTLTPGPHHLQTEWLCTPGQPAHQN